MAANIAVNADFMPNKAVFKLHGFTDLARFLKG